MQRIEDCDKWRGGSGRIWCLRQRRMHYVLSGGVKGRAL
jgi:hypothetical protein